MNQLPELDPVFIHLLRGACLLGACWVMWWALQLILPKTRSIGYTFWRSVIVLMLGMTIVQLAPAKHFVRVELGTDSPVFEVPADPSFRERFQPFEDPTIASPFITHAEPTMSFQEKLAIAWQALTILWGIGIFFGLVRLLAAHWRLARYQKEAVSVDSKELQQLVHQGTQRLGMKIEVQLLEHSGIQVPFTWGIFKPKILIPSTMHDWPLEDRRMAILHELAHIRGQDTLFQFLAAILGTLHWLNPMVWIGWRKFAMERELHADAAVLATGASPTKYASLLVRLASRYREQLPCHAGSISMARSSSVPTRVSKILGGTLNRKGVWAPVLWIAMGLLGGIALTLGITSLTHRKSDLESQQIKVKVYQVHPGFGGKLRPEDGLQNVGSLLESKYGIPRVPDSSASFNPVTNKLILRNTLANHELFQTVLASAAEAETPQVHISARFVKLPNALIGELMPQPAREDGLVGVFTQAELQPVMLSINRHEGTSIINAPDLLTRSGQNGRVKVGSDLWIQATPTVQHDGITMNLNLSVGFSGSEVKTDFKITDGNTLLLFSDAGPENFGWIFVTPRLVDPAADSLIPIGPGEGRIRAENSAKLLLGLASP